jgi:hypothetical protein
MKMSDNISNTVELKAVVRAMDAAFTLSASMELSERQETSKGVKENVKVGDTTVSYPTLEDFGIAAEHDLEAEKARKVSDRFPIYSDARMQWLFDSVVARVQAIARSKFLKGKLRDNAEVPVDFETLLERGERGGEFLKIKSEAKQSFAKHLESIGKSEQVQAAFLSLFINPESIVTASDRYANALVTHLGNWVSSLTEVEAARFAKLVVKANESHKARAATLPADSPE